MEPEFDPLWNLCLRKKKPPYQKELGADCTIPRLHHRPWLANTSCAAQSAIAKSDGRTGMGSQGIARWSALPLCILQDEENQSRQQRIWRTGGNGYRFWPLVQQEMGRIFFLNLEMGRILSPSFQRFCGTVQVGLVSTGYARQTMVGKKSQMVLHRTTVHGHHLDVHKKNPIISSL